jgi:type IV pilus assembly protein PilQ
MDKKIVLLLCIVLFIPTLCFGQVSRAALQKVSFDFMDADVRNVVRALADLSKRNVVIAEDVKGRITIKLDNVTVDEALDLVLRNSGFARIDEESITRVVSFKTYDEEQGRKRKERDDILKEREVKEKAGAEFVTETVYVNYADAQEVERMIRGLAPLAGAGATPGPAGGAAATATTRGLLTPNGVVTLVRWNSALIIKDTKENVANIVRVIKEHDIPPFQVQIEARIVQANKDFSKQLGVQWGANYRNRIRNEPVQLTGPMQPTKNDSSTTTYQSLTGNLGMRDSTVQFPYNVNFPIRDALSTAGGALGVYVGGITDSLQIDVMLQALETEGRGKIISNPKVVTSDNFRARITQGTQIPYQTVSASGTMTDFKDAVLQLDVTPHVTKDGNIRLTIEAKKDAPNFDKNFPIPGIDKKEARTELLVRDGETAVLGGIYEVSETQNESGIPVLRNIPLLGWLFKSNLKENHKTELLIFITPTILKNLYKDEG